MAVGFCFNNVSLHDRIALLQWNWRAAGMRDGDFTDDCRHAANGAADDVRHVGPTVK